jgi:murein L,D-transpeptidase YcbB/YkuD
VRVQNVRDLAVWLLGENADWPRQRIESVIATRVNTPIKLAQEVPVYFSYVTAWSPKEGVVQFRDDIYQMDGDQELALQTTAGMEKLPGAIDQDAVLPQ